jgi:hypothetical protein
MKRAKKRRRTAFVPSAVFGTVFAGVVPAIVSCGATDVSSGQTAGGDAASKDATDEDVTYYGVGAPCCSVAATFDAGPDRREAAVDAPADSPQDGPEDANDGG